MMIQLTARDAPPLPSTDRRLAVNPDHIAHIQPMTNGCDLFMSPTGPRSTSRLRVKETYDKVITMLGYEPRPRND